MNHRNFLAALLALSLSLPGASFAQKHGKNDRGPGARGGPEHHQRGGPKHHQRGGAKGHRYVYVAPPHHGDHYRYDRYVGRGAGPDHNFYRGQRLSRQYRSQQYVISDWRGHHLSAPPRGYHWVQTGSDYLLVAVATGIILQLLINN